MPIGQFLLIRKGNQIGALRITRITPDAQKPQPQNDWLGTVAYESYFTDGKHPLATSPQKISSELHFDGWTGLGHYRWQSGRTDAHVGPWKFLFFDSDGMFMTAVNFWHGTDEDSGLQFAATSATNITGADPNDSRLHWFRFDPNLDVPCPVPTPPTHN